MDTPTPSIKKVFNALDRASPNYRCQGVYTRTSESNGPWSEADMIAVKRPDKHKLVEFFPVEGGIRVQIGKGWRYVMFE